MAVKTIIADDEVLARQKLRQLLADEAIFRSWVRGPALSKPLTWYSSPTRICSSSTSRCPVWMLLHHPPLSACEGVRMPCIIFTTAFDQYAIRAFEINAADYLLKPFTRERLTLALQHARNQVSSFRDEIHNSKRPSEVEHYTTRIVFKSKGRILFLPVTDIRWIAAEENYLRICTGRESHLLRETMAHFETRLDPGFFIRVATSTIVNLQYVKEIRTAGQEGDLFVLMQDGQKLSVSRGYRTRITQLLAH